MYDGIGLLLRRMPGDVRSARRTLVRAGRRSVREQHGLLLGPM